MELNLQKHHIDNIKQKGYSKIENFFNNEILRALDNEWTNIVNLALKSHVRKLESGSGRAKNVGQILPKADVYKKNGAYDLWKAHYILIHTEIGKSIIDRLIPLIRKINPNLVYMKDRIMNQGPYTKGHKPHQDTASGRQGFFEKYTTAEKFAALIAGKSINGWAKTASMCTAIAVLSCST